jgi:haloacetate dehalogenase
VVLELEEMNMAELDDLFPGFSSEWITTSTGRISTRVGGEGPPLLLLHGYPQTHAMWHRIAPQLAERFTLVIADLPGYGSSDIPLSDTDHTPFTKRAMAQTFVQVMHDLGHSRFAVAGHDRGARVAYRMALDQPEHLSRLAVIDILPTYDYWNKLDRLFALRIYHWAFLAQPYPLPENLIQASPDKYFLETLRGWSKSGLDSFDARALEHYLSPLREPQRIHVVCEDYRAGAHADFEQDQADFEAGKKITVPLLVLWGSSGVAASASTPLDIWRKRALDVRGEPIDSGHFPCEEAPAATMQALLDFFAVP